jgi:hypothetical protein
MTMLYSPFCLERYIKAFIPAGEYLVLSRLRYSSRELDIESSLASVYRGSHIWDQKPSVTRDKDRHLLYDVQYKVLTAGTYK